MSNALSGRSSLSYRGTNAVNPPNWSYRDRNPTSQDAQNYSLGDLWLNTDLRQAWMLVSLAGVKGSPTPLIATWIPLNTGMSGADIIQGNTGGFVAGNGASVINFLGDLVGLDVVGNPGTHTLTLSLANTGSVRTLQGDTGGAVSSSGGNINLLGTGGVISTTGAGNTITIDTVALFTSTFDTNAGTAQPSANILNVRGGSNISVSGSGNTITIAASPSVTQTNLTTTNLTVTTSETFGNLGQGVVQSDGSGVLSSSKGTDGQVLIASTAGAPVWANLTAGANIAITNGPNSIMIAQSGNISGYKLIGSSGGPFTNIPSTYKTLMLVCNGVYVQAGVPPGNFYPVYVKLSSDNGVTYYTNYTGGINYTYNQNLPGSRGNANTSLGLGASVTYNNGSFGFLQYAFVMYIYNVNSGVGPVTSVAQGAINVGNISTLQTLATGVCTSTLTGPINALIIGYVATPLGYASLTNGYSLYGLT
jgi:hypothetical protein